jgi:tripartite-type tricarboxylate transporter receptor subunit TctC
MRRRHLLLAAPALLTTHSALAFPDRTLTIVVPYAPGSSLDVLARVMVEHLQRSGSIGGGVVVNREGGSGIVGMRSVAQSGPDGHVIGITPMTPVVVQSHLVRNAGTGPDSLAPVCGLTENILGLVVASNSPIKDLPGLVAAAKQRQLTFGTAGPNSLPYFCVHRLQLVAGGDYLHVPFRGGAPVLTELLGGRLDFGSMDSTPATALVRSGEIRLLNTFADRRVPQWPDTPTAKELGYDAVQSSYVGVYASRAVPEAVLDRLAALWRDVMGTEAFARGIAQAGATVAWRDRPTFTRMVNEEYVAFGRMLRDLGVQPE